MSVVLRHDTKTLKLLQNSTWNTFKFQLSHGNMIGISFTLLQVNATAWYRPLKEGMYPFGTNPWTLGSDICGMGSGTVVNLTLSVCGKGQFTCADGKCVDLSQRCDLRVDCSDQSDEIECSLVDIPPGYSTVIPPPPINVSHPLNIHFMIRILAFPSIATQDQTFTTTLQLNLRWQDIRLNYLNLKTVRSLNLLEPQDVRNIWTPRVFFVNAKGNLFTNLAQGARVECVLGGPSVPGPPHLPKEGQSHHHKTGNHYTVTNLTSEGYYSSLS